MKKFNQINQLIEVLNLRQAFFATQCPSDIESFCREYPSKVAGIVFVGPSDINAEPFKSLAPNIMFLKSQHGSTGVTAKDLQSQIAGLKIYELENYDILPWSDIAIDRPDQLIGSMSSFFASLKIQHPEAPLSPERGEIGDISYTVQGDGPALILLPFSLSAHQWGPIIEKLTKHFTVITARGPNLGFVPVLEKRASLPTYQNMLSTLVSIMNIPVRGQVLELGCGTAILCRQALKLRPDIAITGADINDYLLTEGANIAEKAGIKVNRFFDNEVFQQSNFNKPGELNITYSDAENIQFPDNSFDSVFSVTVLEECDSSKTLKEIYRILKPGGVAGIVVRAIDIAQWWNLDVTQELNRIISIPPQLVSPQGVADKSLYTKMETAGFTDLVCYPYLFSATTSGGRSFYEWFCRRTRQNLTNEFQEQFDEAIKNTDGEKELIFSSPLHCSVGWK